MELKGTVVQVGETQTFASGFSKRMLVIEAVDGNYTNQFGVQALKENVSKFDGISEGQEVVIEVFDNSLARCREYEGKWYFDAPTVKSVEVVGGNQSAPEPDLDDEDDVPFNDD